jgi:hypothetical protein
MKSGGSGNADDIIIHVQIPACKPYRVLGDEAANLGVVLELKSAAGLFSVPPRQREIIFG